MRGSLMPIGDVRSGERGSGARFNDGKPPLELIPVAVFAETVRYAVDGSLHHSLEALARFQAGHDGAIFDAIREVHDCLPDAAAVLDYGARKYAAWNWAKGMDWSICCGCALRHVDAIARGEDVDQESGLPHVGHYLCNLIFLAHYVFTYPDGDDRPPREAFS